jgi:CHAD domain-containing protein
MSEDESQILISPSLTVAEVIPVLPVASESATPKSLAEIIVLQLRELNGFHQEVLATSEVEAVHKMRVTTRRLQASLDLLQFGKQEIKIRKLKRKLRNWRRKLSRIRNYDVFLESLELEAAKHKSIQRSLAALKEELHNRRDYLARKVTTYLEKVSVAKIAAALALEIDFSLEPSTDPEANADGEETSPTRQNGEALQPLTIKLFYSLAHIAEEDDIYRRASKRIDQRVEEFLLLASQAKPTTHPEELHQLRIASKRLRYLLEISENMGHGGSHTALEWLRSLQDRIGEWHDLESLENEILTIIANRDFMKERLAETGVILAATLHLQKKRKALVSRLFPVKVHKRVETSSKRIARAFRRKS